MNEIPHIDCVKNFTDDKLFEEMDELEHDIFRIFEEYCKDNDLGFGVYMGMAAYVRKLTACAWVAGRRNLKGIEAWNRRAKDDKTNLDCSM